MIVSCSSCETKFEIPDDTYRPGRKARCSLCGEIFVLQEQDADIAPPAVSPKAHDPSVTEHDVAEEGGAPSAEDSDSESMPEVDDAFADGPYFNDRFSAQERAFPPASPDDIVPPDAPKAASSKPGKKRWIVGLGIVLVLALLTYGGVMVYSVFFASPKTGDPDRVSDPAAVASLGGRSSGADPEKEAARLAAVRRLALENVRQYTVTENENTGPMIVVEGTVVNNFDTPKDLVLLEVTLFDKKGNPLVLREQYCGVVLSLLHLRTLARPAIESALVSQYMILTNNTDIPPGGRVPFTTVFFDLPESAYEFEVKIVDVQDSKKKEQK